MKATFLLGSTSDEDFAKKIGKVLDEFDISWEIIVASAHKVPEMVVDVMNKLNADSTPQVVITVVGMSNGLAGVAAASLVHPVINCPPYETIDEYMVDIHSNLRYPSEVPAMTVLSAKNAAVAAAKILGEANPEMQEKVRERIKKIKSTY